MNTKKTYWAVFMLANGEIKRKEVRRIPPTNEIKMLARWAYPNLNHNATTTQPETNATPKKIN